MSLDSHVSRFDDVPTAHDPDLLARQETVTPERRLWQACIARAWLDAFKPPRVAGSEFNVTDEERWEARRWLVSRLDPWREDRLEVCDYAGVDESLLRRAAVARLAVAKREEAEAERAEARREHKRDYNRQRMRHIRAQQKIDRAFEELLSAESSMSSADLDRMLSDLAEMESLAA